MITQGIFQKVEYHLDIDSLKPFNVYCFGDVHYGVDGLHAEDHFNEFLRHARKDKTALFIEMGDSLDVCSGSERKVFSSRPLHVQTERTIEQSTVYPIIDRYCKKIGFMKDRMMVKINGNHYWELGAGPKGERILTGTTSDHIIAERMGCPTPPGVCCLLTLKINYHGCKTNIPFYIHHGKGGITMTPVMKMQQGAPHAQIFLMGHNHGLAVEKMSGLIDKPGPQVGHKTIVFARTGSMLKGYVVGMPSYVCDALFRPSELGVLKLTFKPMNDKRKNGQGFHCRIEATI